MYILLILFIKIQKGACMNKFFTIFISFLFCLASNKLVAAADYLPPIPGALSVESSLNNWGSMVMQAMYARKNNGAELEEQEKFERLQADKNIVRRYMPRARVPRKLEPLQRGV